MQYLNGIISTNSINGVCRFDDLQITTLGTYKIKISSIIGSLTIYNNTDNFTLTANPMSISIAQASITTTAYFLFNLTVNAYQNNNVLFANNADFYLEVDDGTQIGNYNPINVNTGTHTFSIYLINPGTKIITASVGNLAASVKVSVYGEKYKISLSSTVRIT